MRQLAGGIENSRRLFESYPSAPVAEYLAELGEDRLHGLHNDEEPLDDVNLVFDASYRRLSEAERHAFAALAVMPADFDREAGKAVIESTRPDGSAAAKSLDRLVHLNLLDYDEAQARLGWHELLKEFAAGHLDEAQAERARTAHAAYFTELAWRAEELYLQGNEQMLAGLKLFDHERQHLEAAFDFLAVSPNQAEALILLVESLVFIGDLRFHPRSRIYWMEALLLAARQMGVRQMEAHALGNLGIAHGELDEPRKAIGYYEQALVIDQEICDRCGEGAILCNLGLSYADLLGEPRKSINYFEQALVIHREISDRRGESADLCNLGVSYADLDEPRKAIAFYEQALVIDRETGDLRGQGLVLRNLGNVYADLSEPRKAIGYYEQELVIDREIGDRRSEGIALGNLGSLYCILGDLHQAIECYMQQLAIAREIGDRRGEGNALINLALAYDDLGKRAQALSLADQALAIYEAIEDSYAAKIRETLAQWRGGNGAT